MSIKKLKLIIRISGVVIILLLAIYFVASDINFNDELISKKEPGQYSSIITTLFPASRVNIILREAWQIKQEPVYFTVRLPNLYDKVSVRVLFKNNCCPTVKLGILQVNGEWDYQLETVDNKDFNNLSWPYITSGDLTLWQKNDDYGSLSEWLRDLPTINKIASYNFDLDKPYLMADYKNYRQSIKRKLNIIGGYAFYTYVNNEILNIEFQFDNIDYDRANIALYDLNKNKFIQDDIDDNEFEFKVEDLSEGVYRIVISGQAILTKSINTKHSQLAFINRFELAEIDQPIELITNSTIIEFKADDFAGLQNITINDDELVIDEIGKKFVATNLQNLSKLIIAKGNINLYGNGYFAFIEDDFFAPMNNKVEIIDSTADYDYLIAKYKIPNQENDLDLNKVEFNISQAAIVKGKLRFIISAPGVSQANPLLIKAIEVIYEKKSAPINIWTELINYLKYWYRFII